MVMRYLVTVLALAAVAFAGYAVGRTVTPTEVRVEVNEPVCTDDLLYFEEPVVDFSKFKEIRA